MMRKDCELTDRTELRVGPTLVKDAKKWARPRASCLRSLSAPASFHI